MTILNVFASADRVLLAVDSLATHVDGRAASEVSKFLWLPHANCVVAGCGRMVLTNLVFWNLLQQPGDFDFVAEAVPQLIDKAWAEADALRAEHAPHLRYPYEGFVIAGWSPRQRRMRVLAQERRASDSTFSEPWEVQRYSLHPNTYPPGELPGVDPSSPDRMRIEAQRQVAWGQLTFPDYAIGGRLLVAEITRDGMTFHAEEI